MLEQLLMRGLHRNLNVDSFFSGPGIGASFSAKIVLAHVSGLISEDERRELDLLRRIRNEFAHSFTATFKRGGSASDRAAQLRLGERLYVPREIPEPKGKAQTAAAWADGDPADLPVVDLRLPQADIPRVRFEASIRAMMSVLVARASEIERHATSPAEYQRPDEPLAALLNAFDRLRGELVAMSKRAATASDTSGAPSEAQTIAEAHENLLDDLVPGLDERQLKAVNQVLRYSVAVVRNSYHQA